MAMESDQPPCVNAPADQLIINEAQLLLAEKRTSLATLRTGIAVLALPLTLASFLIVLSSRVVFDGATYLLWPVLTLCAGLVVLGAYLIGRALWRLQRADRLLQRLKRDHAFIGRYMA